MQWMGLLVIDDSSAIEYSMYLEVFPPFQIKISFGFLDCKRLIT